MITSSVVRFARTASAPITPLHSAATTSACCLASSSLSSQLSYQSRKAHQRRNSSSKAPVPPNGSSSPSRVRRSSAATTPAGETTASATGRSVRGRKPKAPSVEGAFSHLPSVPSTDHLHVADVYASSFFSLHRPISVTSIFPSKTTPASFAKIFDSNRPSRHEPSEVIKTLGSAIEDIEGVQTQSDEFIDESGSSIQGAHEFPLRTATPRDMPMSKFEQFRPYAPPPPPEALDGTSSSSAKTPRRASKKEMSSTTRSWQATINVTEETTASGQKIYTATPMSAMVVNMHEEPGTDSNGREQTQISTSSSTIIPQPFLEKMRSRQQTWHAISVKRQRKLKMKKHKYKKLMKRTRNERRRLGKI